MAQRRKAHQIRPPATQCRGREIYARVREALNELLQRRPGISISLVRETTPITDQAFLETYIDGLREAGVPEG